MMHVLHVTGLFAANTVWRVTGSRRAGRVLMRGLASNDASVRTIAGILIVRGGERAVPLIREALDRGINLPQTLVMAGDVGATSLESHLRSFANHPDPAVSKAASDGLRILAARSSLKPAEE